MAIFMNETYTSGNHTTDNACNFVQWQVWCMGSATNAATETWQAWNGGTGAGMITGQWGSDNSVMPGQWGGPYEVVTYDFSDPMVGCTAPARVISPEELAEMVAQEKVAREAREQRDLAHYQEQVAAATRAERLLLETLSPTAQAQYLAKGTVTVIAKSGRVYEITKGRARNVYELDPSTRKRQSRLCAHPVDGVPDQDTMLAQKLMLEHAETEFLAMANRLAV